MLQRVTVVSMKRRRLLQSIAAIPAAAALPLPAQSPDADKQELTTTSVTQVGQPVPRFFSEDQLKALSDICLTYFYTSRYSRA